MIPYPLHTAPYSTSDGRESCQSRLVRDHVIGYRIARLTLTRGNLGTCPLNHPRSTNAALVRSQRRAPGLRSELTMCMLDNLCRTQWLRYNPCSPTNLSFSAQLITPPNRPSTLPTPLLQQLPVFLHPAIMWLVVTSLAQSMSGIVSAKVLQRANIL